MKRHAIQPRADWKRKVEQLGLLFHKNEEGDYWDDSSYYELNEQEVDVLEEATNTLHQMCLEAADYVVRNQLFHLFSIPPKAAQWVEESWHAREPSIYGRFDLSFNGIDPPKLLEYNADTPTSLIESAVIQWHWLQEVRPTADQFNSIWEGLVERWTSFRQETNLGSQILYFASAESVEDFMTITALQDTAIEAGLVTEALLVEDIGWNSKVKRFVDLQDRPIGQIFKLYPWEFIVNEPFGEHLLNDYKATRWIEPIWKMLLSNKALLPILWQLFPDCPYILEAHLDEPFEMASYVKKPILGREGAGVTVVSEGKELSRTAEFPDQRYVYQAYAPLPEFDGNSAVIGSWVIDGVSRGIGIRESSGPITTNLSRFVPHLFESNSAS
jgi:glutathionylspermidine synthase